MNITTILLAAAANKAIPVKKKKLPFETTRHRTASSILDPLRINMNMNMNNTNTNMLETLAEDMRFERSSFSLATNYIANGFNNNCNNTTTDINATT